MIFQDIRHKTKESDAWKMGLNWVLMVPQPMWGEVSRLQPGEGRQGPQTELRRCSLGSGQPGQLVPRTDHQGRALCQRAARMRQSGGAHGRDAWPWERATGAACFTSWGTAAFTVAWGCLHRTAVLSLRFSCLTSESLVIKVIPGVPILRIPKQLCQHFKQTYLFWIHLTSSSTFDEFLEGFF